MGKNILLKLNLFLIISFAFTSCSFLGLLEGSEKEITLVNWNVQTFFDGSLDGIEYSEFKKNDVWNEGKYKIRLERLCQSLKKLDSDIVVLEEIENSGILIDISNTLSGSSWKNNSGWNYACFTKEEGSAIGCAVLSKFPIKKVTSHSLDVRTQKSFQPSMRPVSVVEIEVRKKTFCLIVNHWKSKSGGAEKSEIWRDWQEAVAGMCVEQSEKPCILSGDFNRDADEFIHSFEAEDLDAMNIEKSLNPMNTIFRTFYGNEEVKLYSPWYDSCGEYAIKTGSYYYKGKWERIDHFFSTPSVKILNFEVCNDSPWINEDGSPFSYRIYNGKGYSDHLPVKCKFIIL